MSLIGEGRGYSIVRGAGEIGWCYCHIGQRGCKGGEWRGERDRRLDGSDRVTRRSDYARNATQVLAILPEGTNVS